MLAFPPRNRFFRWIRAAALSLLSLFLVGQVKADVTVELAQITDFNRKIIKGIKLSLEGKQRESYQVCMSVWLEARQSAVIPEIHVQTATRASDCVGNAMLLGGITDENGNFCPYKKTALHYSTEALAGAATKFSNETATFKKYINEIKDLLQRWNCGTDMSLIPVSPPGAPPLPLPKSPEPEPAAPPESEAAKTARIFVDRLDMAQSKPDSSPKERYDNCVRINNDAAAGVTEQTVLAFVYSGTSLCMALAARSGDDGVPTGNRCRLADLADQNAVYSAYHWTDMSSDLLVKLMIWKKSALKLKAEWQC